MVSLWLSCVPVATAMTVQEVPNPRQTSGGWVTDMAELLSSDAEAEINQIAIALEADTQAELAVVTVPTIDPATSPKAFATELFNIWGIGKADQDNGLLILVSRDDRRVEIETGRGTANILPDDQVAMVIRTVVVPRFRQEDYAGGIIQVTQRLADEIRNNADRRQQLVIPPVIWQLLGVGLLGLSGIWGLLRWRSRRPTPLTMGEQQTRRDVLYPTRIQTWVGEHPPRQLTGLFLAPVLVTMAIVLGSLTFIGLTVARYWGGAIFSLSLLIPLLAALLIVSGTLMFLMTWLRDKKRFLAALREAIQPEWGDVVSFALVSMCVLFILLGFAKSLGWVPRSFFLWMQQPTQATGLVVGCSLLLSGKLLEAFETGSVRYRIKHQAFCCDRHHTPLNLVQPEQLEPLLTSEQRTAFAAKTIKVVGWHCPACNGAINRESTHLQIAKIYRRSPSSGSENDGRSHTSSDSSSASGSTYEPNYYPDTSSSSSDFGGGGSDGGGAGDNW